MTSENTTLGRRIMSLRKAAGLTQEQLAEKLGVSPQAVSKWENDVSCPDISALPLIASIFGVSSDELLGIKQPDTPPAAMETAGKSHISRSGIGLGILMIVLGAAFLISRTADMPFSLWDVLWPAALLGVGIAGAIEHRSLFCLGISGAGLYFLLTNLSNTVPFKLDWNSVWPIALILLGLDIVLHRLFPSVFRSKKFSGTHRFNGNSVSKYNLQNGFISSETVFGEKHYAVESCEISGGDIQTVFGQCTMDLSRCTFAAEAELMVEVSFGHLRLILPASAKAVPKAESAFGSVDIASAPNKDAAPIIIRGQVAFGNMEISYK